MRKKRMKNLRIVIITGTSGSGKSTALRALEDIGFYCVDNLPIVLLPKFLEMQSDAASEISKIGLGMDLREKLFVEKYTSIFSELKEQGYRIEIVFLDASDEVLLARFKETRRTHPVSDKGNVMEGIALEREKLAELKSMADKIIDTSTYNVHQLKETVQKYFMTSPSQKKLLINLISFGYRYGIPPDADNVLDVRFLPNPYFIENLKECDGCDKRVEDYVMEREESKTFLRELFKIMEFLIPNYEKEGKAYLNIALGCTGGKHRSVVMSNKLGEHLAGLDYIVNISHRDMKR
jgi:UPF0042 nucleotide-binding protein